MKCLVKFRPFNFIIYLDLWQESEEDGKLDYVRKKFFKFFLKFLKFFLF